MKAFPFKTLAFLVTFSSLAWSQESPAKFPSGPLQPICQKPLTRSDDIVHRDPYRWLETSSNDRNDWIFRQQQATENVLNQFPSRAAVRDLVWKINEDSQDLMDYELGNGFEVVLVDRGLRAPNEIVLRKNGEDQRILFSTDTVATDGSANLTTFFLDPRRQRVVVPVTRNGSLDICDLHIVNIESGVVEEVLKDVGDYGITWVSPREFLYSKYADRDGMQLSHTLGDSRGDRLSRHTREAVSNDPHNHYVIMTEKDKTVLRSLDGNLESTLNFEVESVVAENDHFLYVTRERPDEWVEVVQLTKQISPTGQVSFVHSQVIETAEHGRFDGAWADKGSAFLTFRLGDKYWANLIDSRGLVTKRIELPQGVDVSYVEFKSSVQAELTLTSAIQKEKRFTFDLAAGRFKDDEVSSKMLTDAYGTRYIDQIITAKSKDGKEFPIRLTYKEGLVLDGSNPALVEGYGGFGAAGYFDPHYNVMNYHFLRQGGVYVAPILRGGPELGPQFRNDAKFKGKQNTFNDMIATLERISELKFSNPQKIAAMGWSNGGLLLGALVTQRPDLLRVGVPGNGVQDMLRKRILDPRFGNGWEYEYGSSDDPEMFKVLAAYSPVNNAKPAHYPITLIIAGLNDSRVNNAHSFKLAAAIQAAQLGANPVMLFGVPQAGHWASKPQLQDVRAVDTLTAIWTTIYDGLGMTFSAPLTSPKN